MGKANTDHRGQEKGRSILLERVESRNGNPYYLAHCGGCRGTWETRLTVWNSKEDPLCGPCSRKAQGARGRGKPGASSAKSYAGGERVGKWTMTGAFISDPTSRQRRWLAVCDCGRQAHILGQSLRSGRSMGCGRCSVPVTDEGGQA